MDDIDRDESIAGELAQDMKGLGLEVIPEDDRRAKEVNEPNGDGVNRKLVTSRPNSPIASKPSSPVGDVSDSPTNHLSGSPISTHRSSPVKPEPTVTTGKLPKIERNGSAISKTGRLTNDQ